jgi:hypothetical protein
VCASLLTLGVAACDRSPQGEPMTKDTEAEQKAPSVESVSEHPERFLGKTVTLSGEVDHIYGDRAFQLEDQGDVIFEDKVLVLTKSPVRLGGVAPRDDDEVVVTGKVRRLQVAELERDLGWDLTPDIEKEFGSKAVVVADSIDRVARTASWSERDQSGALVGIWSVYTVVDPVRLAGQKLNLSAIPVQGVAKKGFWVGYRHSDQLFVKSPDGGKMPATGELVDVNGTLQKMPAAQEAVQQFGIDQGLQKQVGEEVVYLDAKGVSTSKQAQPTTQRD